MKNVSVMLGVLLLSLLIPAPAHAQSVSYDDVLIIVNDSSWASRDIGDYFATRRAIPASHICHIRVDTAEVVDSLRFKAIQWQIQEYMRTNNLVNAINYIVTTKGCPLRVTTMQQDAPSAGVYAGLASFEDLLVVINGPDSSLILAPKNNYSREWVAPYFNATTRFQRTTSLPIYLVTRLDGYTVENVKALIRRAETPASPGSGTYVFDKAPNRDETVNGVYYETSNNKYLGRADSVVRSHGDPSRLSTLASEYLHGVTQVIGYASWGSNDAASGGGYASIPGMTWLNGGIAETAVSTGGRSFMPGTSYGQSLIADWIAEGVSGIKGYTDEPFGSAVAQTHILFDRYRTRGWNMAESFYAASNYYVWRQVIIGDPKMQLGRTITVGTTPVAPTLSVPAQVTLKGAAGSTTASGTVRLQNLSTTQSVTISSLTFVGSSYFGVKNTVTLPHTIAAGQSWDVAVTYAPPSFGSGSASLIVGSNASAPSQSVSVTGTTTAKKGGSSRPRGGLQ